MIADIENKDNEDDNEDYDSIFFDDDSIPLVKITSAPPLIEEEMLYHRQNTYNHAYLKKYQLGDLYREHLQVQDFNINPPLQRSRTGNQDKKVQYNSPIQLEENKDSGDQCKSSQSKDEYPQIPLNKNNLFAFSDTIDSVNRQNSHNSKVSSASIMKSNDDSDDSFTSINTDIQNTINNEQQIFLQKGKFASSFGRQGTYGYKKEQRDNLLNNAIQNCENIPQQTIQIPFGNTPFGRSLTSQTQYKGNLEQVDNQDRFNDEESLYTEEDQIESLSHEDTRYQLNNDNQYLRSQTFKESCKYKINILASQDDDQPADPNFLSPLKFQIRERSSNGDISSGQQEASNNTLSSQNQNYCNSSPKSWGGIPNSPLNTSNPMSIKINLQGMRDKDLFRAVGQAVLIVLKNQKIEDNLVRIALDKHGTRALQNMLNQICPFTNERSARLINGIRDYALELIVNIHGNHVIQICLDNIKSEELKLPIYECVLNNCSYIATNQHGCCVVQKLLSSSKFAIQVIINDKFTQFQKELVLRSLEQLQYLINDQYGNYVVQQVLKFNDEEINLKIANFICSKIQYYCSQKISSNVVENAIRITTNECKKVYFTNLIKNLPLFRMLMLDQYGNYVIHAILQTSSDFQDQTYYNQFYRVFIENQELLRKVNFGNKFIQKIMVLDPPQQDQQNFQFQRQQLQITGKFQCNNNPKNQSNTQRTSTFKSAPVGKNLQIPKELGQQNQK
ncbi:rna-binding protein [Stylonychia lemnae]|uniref:Rna-binding protein n=1 Tax=Stylonychia lemnae TaxID=5949 RepID=A0A077ZT11_STYLE|nr:rna-binding protein [Stylonychia lemnae]|eukprot:CDW73022.1 rna-binding protein [Stylonychia lemnae]